MLQTRLRQLLVGVIAVGVAGLTVTTRSLSLKASPFAATNALPVSDSDSDSVLVSSQAAASGQEERDAITLVQLSDSSSDSVSPSPTSKTSPPSHPPTPSPSESNGPAAIPFTNTGTVGGAVQESPPGPEGALGGKEPAPHTWVDGRPPPRLRPTVGAGAARVPPWEPRRPRQEYDCARRIPQLTGIDDEVREGFTDAQRTVDFSASGAWMIKLRERIEPASWHTQPITPGDTVELELALRIGPGNRSDWATLNESRAVGNHFLVYVYGPGNLTTRVRDAVVPLTKAPRTPDEPEAVFRASFRLPRPGKYCVDLSFYGLTVGRTNPSIIQVTEHKSGASGAGALRPRCTKADLTRPNFAGEGFWADAFFGPRVLPVWHEAHCDFRLFTQSEALRCFQNQTVHFVGDSLIRQLYAGVLSILNGTYPKDENQSPWFWDSHSFSFQNATIKLYSQDQGRQPTNLVKLAETTELVGSINVCRSANADSLQFHSGHLFVLNSFLHESQMSAEAYGEMLHKIFRAALRANASEAFVWRSINALRNFNGPTYWRYQSNRRMEDFNAVSSNITEPPSKTLQVLDTFSMTKAAPDKAWDFHENARWNPQKQRKEGREIVHYNPLLNRMQSQMLLNIFC
jgi:hypothetical protein